MHAGAHREALGDLGEHASAAGGVAHETEVLADALHEGEGGLPRGKLERLLDHVVSVLVLRNEIKKHASVS